MHTDAIKPCPHDLCDDLGIALLNIQYSKKKRLVCCDWWGLWMGGGVNLMMTQEKKRGVNYYK